MGLEGTRKKKFNSPSQAVLLDVDDFENAARLTIFFLSGAGFTQSPGGLCGVDVAVSAFDPVFFFPSSL